MSVAARSLEALLIQEGVITEQILEKARERQREGRTLGDVLQEMGAIDGKTWAKALAEHYGLPFSETVQQDAEPKEWLDLLPINFAKRFQLVPMGRDGDAVVLAIADPTALGPIDDVRLLLHRPVRPVVAPPEAVLAAINRVYDLATGTAEKVVDELHAEDLGESGVQLEGIKDLLDVDESEAPIIRLVNSLLFQAAKDRASDIHIEPFERDLAVRFRIDGILYDIISPPKKSQATIISRVKIMAGLNIAEKRLPQDGRIRVKLAGKDVDIRVSTIPTAYGERVVMRLLDRSNTVLRLDELGLAGRKHELVSQLIKQPHGIVLVTGPTGSGKTTTLYATLKRLATDEVNVCTIEDPIEMIEPAFNQTQVQPAVELGFAEGLRALMRQDPDIIMVGEIRDLETAEMAIQAALTGHLVFSTLHTNDSVSAVTRLTDLGVPPYLINATVIGVLAQRLVRTLCPACKQPDEQADLAPLAQVAHPWPLPAPARPFKAVGCLDCRMTGYRGRAGLYELLTMSEPLKAALQAEPDLAALRRIAVKDGLVPLRVAGVHKVVEGQTTLDEVLRSTPSFDT